MSARPADVVLAPQPVKLPFSAVAGNGASVSYLAPQHHYIVNYQVVGLTNCYITNGPYPYDYSVDDHFNPLHVLAISTSLEAPHGTPYGTPYNGQVFLSITLAEQTT